MERRRVKREPHASGVTLVSVAVVKRTPKGTSGYVVGRTEPRSEAVYTRVDIAATPPGWTVQDDGTYRFANLDEVLLWMAGWGIGALESRLAEVAR
jgi:hypothetical protein